MKLSQPAGVLRILPWVLLAAGCSSSKPTSIADSADQSTLGEIYEIYSGFAAQNHKPPAQVSDLKAFKIPYPRGYTEVAEGRFVVRFGTPIEPAGKVLAYQKDVPTKGGMVLLTDGKTKTMTADEVQASLK